MNDLAGLMLMLIISGGPSLTGFAPGTARNPLSLPPEDEALMALARPMVAQHEGERLKPYTDTTGHTTIGIGRNLDDNGISAGEASLLFESDLRKALKDARRLTPNFDKFNVARRAVFTDMSFNLGAYKYAKFKGMFAAAQDMDTDRVAAHMRGSLWCKQVKIRCTRLSAIMKTGSIE